MIWCGTSLRCFALRRIVVFGTRKAIMIMIRKEPVHFVPVRFVNVFFPVRRSSACIFRTCRGSVRFGSAGSVRLLIFLPV